MTAPVDHRDNYLVHQALIFDRTIGLALLRRLYGNAWYITYQDDMSVWLAQRRKRPPLVEVHYRRSLAELRSCLEGIDGVPVSPEPW